LDVGQRKSGLAIFPGATRHFLLRSDSLQILDQIVLIRIAEAQIEVDIVVVDHVKQGGEPPVVEEAAFLMRPQPCQRRRPVS
jgi:hypothetical protein